MRTLLLGIVSFLSVSPAIACPDFGLWGRERYDITARDLYSARGVDVVAGGDISLQTCRSIRPRNWSGAMPGYVIREPDFSISVRGLDGFQIEFRVVSECDSVLLLNTAAGNWYFDDDDNTDSPGDPKIRLTRPAGDGVYDIWVGTFNPDSCDARLTIETF